MLRNFYDTENNEDGKNDNSNDDNNNDDENNNDKNNNNDENNDENNDDENNNDENNDDEINNGENNSSNNNENGYDDDKQRHKLHSSIEPIRNSEISTALKQLLLLRFSATFFFFSSCFQLLQNI